MRLTRIRRHIQGGGLLIMLLTANAGCSVFEHHDNAPIFPMTGAASPMTNFAVGEPVDEAFEWSASPDLLCVNIPAAGDYLLTYLTSEVSDASPLSLTLKPGGEAASFIAFRAIAPARLYIPIQGGAPVTSARLHRGSIKADAVGLYDDGPVIRYATPSIPTIFWSDVFVLAQDHGQISMRSNASVCPPPPAFPQQ